jgi:hypothetical protein
MKPLRRRRAGGGIGGIGGAGATRRRSLTGTQVMVARDRSRSPRESVEGSRRVSGMVGAVVAMEVGRVEVWAVVARQSSRCNRRRQSGRGGEAVGKGKQGGGGRVHQAVEAR